MRVNPYISVNDILFGSSKSLILDVLGQPIRLGKSRIGDIEMTYDDIIFRLSPDTLELIEVSANAPVLLVENEIGKFEDLPVFLEKNDPDAFQTHGFYVSTRFGIAFDPYFPSWVTAFPSTALSFWQRNKKT